MAGDEEELGRRDFLKLLAGWWGLLIASGAGLAGAARFFVPNVVYGPDRRYKAGKPDLYSEGVTFIEEAKIFIMRNGGRFRALSAVCTHLGCTVNRAETGFRCPCHGSRFDEKGAVASGPAPRALAWHPVSLSRDESLVVDRSRAVPPEEALEAGGPA